MRVTAERLIELLMERFSFKGGACFATITACTDARCRKTDNPFGPVRKRQRVNVTLNADYGAAVRRQRQREDDTRVGQGEPPKHTDVFRAQPRAWGTRIRGLPIVEHDGRHYLECKLERQISVEYFDGEGRPLTFEQIKPFLPPPRRPSRQGLEREVRLRDFAIDSIERITLDGRDYEVAKRRGHK